MKYILVILLICMVITIHAEILIPMDMTQTNHLKAYGIAFTALQKHRLYFSTLFHNRFHPKRFFR